jgi:4'-phosphopantetheinyl transferase EntD
MPQETPANVVMATASPADWKATLHFEEAESVSRAGARRKLEFTAGRSCARRLLASLGHHSFPLLNDLDRVPIWPEGIKGSISHSNRFCLALGTCDTSIISLGVDIEEELEDIEEILPFIASEREQAWIAEAGESDRVARAVLLFSAKESVFKCLYPISRVAFEFIDIELQFDLAQGIFRMLPCWVSEHWPAALSIYGRTLSQSPALTLAVLSNSLRHQSESPLKISIRMA